MANVNVASFWRTKIDPNGADENGGNGTSGVGGMVEKWAGGGGAPTKKRKGVPLFIFGD